MVLFVFVMILLRTTMDPVLPSLVRRTDILLPFVVYLGQRRSLPEGIILALFASHLYSLCSAAPIGVFTSHYLILFVLARLLSYVTYANRWYSILVLMFSLALVAKINLAMVATFFGHGWRIFGGSGVIGSLFINALVGYLIYGMLETVDRLTYKAPRINIELSEGDL